MLTDDQAIRFRRIAYGLLRGEKFPAGVEIPDLVSEALLRACKQTEFDPTRSTFPTWVAMHLRSSTLNYLVQHRAQRRDPARTKPLGGTKGDDFRHPIDRATYRRWRSVMSLIDADDTDAPELTPQEEVVLQEFIGLAGSQEVANALCLSRRTIDFHLRNIFRKLGVQSLHLALLEAERRGMIAFL